MKNIKKYFFTGLIILLPLIITLATLIFLVDFLTEPFMGIISPLLQKWRLLENGILFLSPDQLLRYGSKLLILIFLFLFTLGLGTLTRWFFLHSLLNLGDRVLRHIPIVNTVYKTTQDIINTLFVSDKGSFKQVVMVPFPRPDVYILGLVARDAPPTLSSAAKEELVSIFVPTTPNPTTGFLLMFKRSDLILVDMKAEDAIKYIVSCGVIIPKEKPL